MKARKYGNVRVSRLAPYILATLGVIAFAYSASAALAKEEAAALERFEEAKRRFDDFMTGRAATIEEFDEAVRPFGESQKREMIEW